MAIRFAACTDAAWIAECLSQPDVVEVSFPDGAAIPSESDVRAAINSGAVEFIAIEIDGVRIGFFLLELKFPVIELHTVIRKEHRGKSAFQAAREFGKWIFTAYPQCLLLLTQVPQYNRAASLFAVRGGMEKTDLQGDMFCKNGVCEHMHMYVLKRS